MRESILFASAGGSGARAQGRAARACDAPAGRAGCRGARAHDTGALRM